MSRAHGDGAATPAEIDALQVAGLTIGGPAFEAYRLQHEEAAMAEAERLIGDAREACGAPRVPEPFRLHPLDIEAIAEAVVRKLEES